MGAATSIPVPPAATLPVPVSSGITPTSIPSAAVPVTPAACTLLPTPPSPAAAPMASAGSTSALLPVSFTATSSILAITPPLAPASEPPPAAAVPQAPVTYGRDVTSTVVAGVASVPALAQPPLACEVALALAGTASLSGDLARAPDVVHFDPPLQTFPETGLAPLFAMHNHSPLCPRARSYTPVKPPIMINLTRLMFSPYPNSSSLRSTPSPFPPAPPQSFASSTAWLLPSRASPCLTYPSRPSAAPTTTARLCASSAPTTPSVSAWPQFLLPPLPFPQMHVPLSLCCLALSCCRGRRGETGTAR